MVRRSSQGWESQKTSVVVGRSLVRPCRKGSWGHSQEIDSSVLTQLASAQRGQTPQDLDSDPIRDDHFARKEGVDNAASVTQRSDHGNETDRGPT